MNTRTVIASKQETAASEKPLAHRLGAAIVSGVPEAAAEGTARKVKICLIDLVTCALTARDLPWSHEAQALAGQSQGAANIIGTKLRVSPADAAFANAVAAHGLVREDMHAGAISHLGVVVLPALLALAQNRKVKGKDWIDAAIIGYEVGARLGRAILTPEITRLFRPTGITGPVGAAAGAARLMGLDADASASAIALAANTVCGLNEWPSIGGSDMFFHPGFAARNGYMVAMLAESGAFGSPTALDGPAGLFAALQRAPGKPDIPLFPNGEADILAVYNKPIPACNFAQTPCQAAVRLAREEKLDPAAVRAVDIRVSRAAKLYPGCDHAGEFQRLLQAKMSIQFGVAVALANGEVSEEGYARLDDPTLKRLMGTMTLSEDGAFTAAFPAKQGAEVIVTLADGRRLSRSLDNVVPATEEEIRNRFIEVGSSVLGEERARRALAFIDDLESAADVGALMDHLTA